MVIFRRIGRGGFPENPITDYDTLGVGTQVVRSGRTAVTVNVTPDGLVVDRTTIEGNPDLVRIEEDGSLFVECKYRKGKPGHTWEKVYAVRREQE